MSEETGILTDCMSRNLLFVVVCDPSALIFPSIKSNTLRRRPPPATADISGALFKQKETEQIRPLILHGVGLTIDGAPHFPTVGNCSGPQHTSGALMNFLGQKNDHSSFANTLMTFDNSWPRPLVSLNIVRSIGHVLIALFC